MKKDIAPYLPSMFLRRLTSSWCTVVWRKASLREYGPLKKGTVGTKWKNRDADASRHQLRNDHETDA